VAKKKHEPISYEKFVELLEANIGTASDCENAIKATLAKGEFIGSVSGRLLDFFEEFKEEDGQKMVLVMIFFFGIKLGRMLGPEERRPKSEKPKKNKGGNGQLKN